MNQVSLHTCYSELDITKDILQALDEMKDGDIHLTQGFTLYDSMSATELFDKKIDTKMGLEEADTPQNMLRQGIIKLANELTQEEIQGIYDLVLSKEMLWYQGNALAQTIYTLVQQYDDSLTSTNQFIDTLFKSMNSIGHAVFLIIKNGPYLREEDYIFSTFGFKKDAIPLNLMIQDYLNPLDSLAQSQLKKKKQLSVLDGISARVKLRKALANFMSLLSLPYSDDNRLSITTQIDIMRKRIDIIRQTTQFSSDVENYQSKTIFKHIKAMISLRGIPNLTVEETMLALENMIYQIEVVLQIAQERNLFRIIDSLDDLIHKNPKNTVVRAYLELNIYDPVIYFHQVSLISIIKGMLTSLFPTCVFDSTHPDVVVYFEYLNQISHEYMIKMLRGSFRQMRDFHKIYQHFSILMHESTKIDELLFKGTKSPLIIFTYELLLKMTIKQLMLGFELNLYDYCDYQFIFFQLEYHLVILEKNRTNCLNFIPQASQQGKFSQILLALINKTKKKKVNGVQETLFHEITYWRGLCFLFKAYARMCFILTQIGVIENPQKHDIKYRFTNRLKIFEHCYYIKPVTYDEFYGRMEEVYKDETQFNDGIAFVQLQLKEAQDLFKQIPVTEKLCPLWMVDQQKKLLKICVVTSVSLMKLKSARTNNTIQVKVQFSDQSNLPYIPQLDII